MQFNLTRFIALLTVVTVIIPPASATRPAKRRPAPAQKARPTEVLSGQLVYNSRLNDETLAQTCRHSSFKNLAIALNMNAGWLSTPKGEFETSSEYDNRINRLGDAIGKRQTIICEPLIDNPDIEFTYKADQTRFEARFMDGHNVWRDVKQLGSYHSKTRMGIPVTIKASAELEYNVRWEVPSDLKGCMTNRYSSLSFSVPASREVAPGIKRYGLLVSMGRFVSPFISTDESSGDPRLDNPYDVYTRTLTAHLRLERIVVLDGADTEVWSCVLGRLTPSANPTPLGGPEAWLSLADYPSSAIRERRSGTAKVRLNVNKEGAVSGCEVTSSTGSGDLDAATCPALKRRAKFSPAADLEGQPMSGDFTTEIVWKLPF